MTEDTKKCTKCGKTKMIYQFSMSNSSSDGRSDKCIKCKAKPRRVRGGKQRGRHAIQMDCECCGRTFTFLPNKGKRKYCPQCQKLVNRGGAGISTCGERLEAVRELLEIFTSR